MGWGCWEVNLSSNGKITLNSERNPCDMHNINFSVWECIIYILGRKKEKGGGQSKKQAKNSRAMHIRIINIMLINLALSG